MCKNFNTEFVIGQNNFKCVIGRIRAQMRVSRAVGNDIPPSTYQGP